MLLALDNERLRALRLSTLHELRSSRARIVELGDAERRRIERDLHDGAQQRLLAIAFDLRLAAPELPDHDVPAGHTEMTWLRELTMRGAAVRYPVTHPQHDQAMHQIAYELDAPPGATIAVLGGIVFAACVLARSLLRRAPAGAVA